MVLQWYNIKNSGIRMRREEHVITKRAVIWAIVATAFFGCVVDNEVSFYVEHMKSQPAAPECGITESDPFASFGKLDVIFRNEYGGGYLVMNQLMAREDYGNGVAESNGIFVDGMEVYVMGSDGALLGMPEYFKYQIYIEPENTGLAFATLISGSVVDSIAAEAGCPSTRDIAGEKAIKKWNSTIGTVYSSVRFIGHTRGGKDVETPEFFFPVEICCGCLIDWSGCGYDNCETYCKEPSGSGMCTNGVANGGAYFDCRNMFYNPGYTWPPGPGETCADPKLCTCEDCDL